MRESSVVVRPEAKDSGWYSASSRLKAAGLLQAIALFEQAAEVVPIPRSPRPIVIADYGAGTGYNSVLPSARPSRFCAGAPDPSSRSW